MMTIHPDNPRNVLMKRAYRDVLLDCVVVDFDDRCRRLLAVKGKLSAYFRSVIANWPRERVITLLRSRIKQLTWAGVPPMARDKEEAEIEEAFTWPLHWYATPGRPHVTVDYPHRAGVEVDVDKLAVAELDIRRLRKEFTVDRRRLRSRTLGALRPFLGKPISFNGQVLFWTQVEGLTVETVLDFSRPLVAQLLYWHSIYWHQVDERTRSNARFLPPMSIADTLAANGGITFWEHLTDADVDETADLVAELVEDFLSTIPAVVERARTLGS
jgi:hypothetical protein